MSKITITFDNDIELTPKQIGRMIENSLSHLPYNLDITVTPESNVKGVITPANVDVHKGPVFSDIELSPTVYKKLKEIAEKNEVPYDQILRRGMDKLKLKGEI